MATRDVRILTCDRCGKDEEVGPVVYSMTAIQGASSVLTTKGFHEDQPDEKLSSAELCSACASSLVSWWLSTSPKPRKPRTQKA